MMSKVPFASASVVAATLLCCLVGCGLVSSDITTISFDLPARMYSFDTAPLGLPSGSLPAAPCTTAAECCTAAALVGYSCTTNPLSCDSGSCSLTQTIDAPPQTVDLRMQSSQLSGLTSVASVSISRITYDVVSTLNIQLPPVELFLAPMGVTSTTDASATRFGTVPAIPAGATVTGGEVALDPSAGSTFNGYARNLGTPFEFLARATVKVAGGSPFPAGKVDITVSGRLSAKPSL